MSPDDRTPDDRDVEHRLQETFHRQRDRIVAGVDPRDGLRRMKQKDTAMRRSLVPALTAAAAVLLLIGGVALFLSFQGDEVAEPTTTTTTEPGTSTTTTSEPTTTTSTTTTEPGTSTTTTESPTTTTTLVPTGGWDDPRYRVTGVADDDVLNVREIPGAGFPIVATLPPLSLVTVTGYTADVDGVAWYEVVTDGQRGWVNGSFLEEPEFWTSDLGDPACTTDTDGGSEISGPPTSGVSDAGHVLAVLHAELADCERFVIVLGAGPGFGPDDWTGIPAATVPEGVETAGDGSVVRIDLPGVQAARPNAQTVETGDSFVLATRDTPMIDDGGDLSMRIFFDANRTAATRYLEYPARIVVDVMRAPTGTGLDVAARQGGPFVVMPVQVDVNGPGVELPIDVVGWGRPFEASGTAELREAATEPGTGPLVEADFSGTEWVGPERTSSYPVQVADWTEAWGRFDLTIDGLEAGDYELFLGDSSGADLDGPVGVYVEFTVR